MAKQFPALTQNLISFIHNQKIFFVATAPGQGKINLSPKGLDTLRILDQNRLIWLNLTGSGNETAAHVIENSRMTIMFCSFEGPPLILRLYGSAKCIYQGDQNWSELNENFPSIISARQIFDMNIELVQTSCGFGVPLMSFNEERSKLIEWAEQKGKEGIEEYWKEKNTVSLDGRPTGVNP